MKNLCKLLTICVACLCLLAGCEKANTESEVQVDYSALTVPRVDLKITDCISEQELQTILGYPVTLSGMFEENTQAIYTSEDGTCQVTVHMINQTREGFDALVKDSTVEMVRQEGLGEAAYWYGETGQIMVYSGGYALDVAVTCVDIKEPQTYTRQVVEMILRKLPAAPAQ